MNRQHFLALFVFLVLNIATLGALMAQENPYGTAPPPGPSVTTSTISGTLVSSSAESIVVKTDAGIESTFTVDAGSVLPAGMTPGDRVSVEYHMLDGGSYLASRVTSVSGSGTASPATAEGAGSDPGMPAGASGDAREEGSATSPESGGELPRTAGPLPLLAVIGVMAIGAALGLRAIFRRQQHRV